MTGLELDLWEYDCDLADACDEVWDYIEHYGHVRTRVLHEIAEYWAVCPYDIMEELDLY